MKRIGFLKEKMLTPENFELSERLLGKNKPDNRAARHIAQNAKKYGAKLLQKIESGTFRWHEPRKSQIVDSYKGKTRDLKIPCLEDQAAQLAWLNIAIPYIEKRNYFYNCGSIPKAGQTRCAKGLKKWLNNHQMKYGAITDIRKFYESCPHWLVRKGLDRIFKDKWFVEFAMGFVASMSDTGTGLAIGYPSSHWLANVALMELDHELRREHPDVKYTRYMDDMAFASTNRRKIVRTVSFVKEWLSKYGMKLKKWSVFRIKDRGLTFLSYRFFNGYTILSKKLMIRISRRMKKAAKTLNPHTAAGVLSYLGILKHCDSFNFRKEHVYPYISVRLCTALISDRDRRREAA